MLPLPKCVTDAGKQELSTCFVYLHWHYCDIIHSRNDFSNLGTILNILRLFMLDNFFIGHFKPAAVSGKSAGM